MTEADDAGRARVLVVSTVLSRVEVTDPREATSLVARALQDATATDPFLELSSVSSIVAGVAVEEAAA